MKIRGVAWDRRWLRCALIVLAVVLAVLLLMRLGALQAVDSLWLDQLVRNYSRVAPRDPRIVLVFISDETYEKLGLTFPFPRRLYAQYFRKVHALGAAVSGVDIFLNATVDRRSEDVLLDALEPLRNVVFIVKTEVSGKSCEVKTPVGGRIGVDRFPLAHSNFYYRNNIPRFYTDCLMEGVRPYYALPLEALARLENARPLVLDRDPPGRERPWYFPPGAAMQVGERLYHLSGDALHIDYHRAVGGDWFETLTFEDVITRELPEGYFRGRVVMLGTKEKLSHDFHPTPLGTMPGALIHAIFLKNLLDNRLLQPLHPLIPLALTVLAGLLCAFVFPRVRPFLALGVYLSAVALLLAAALSLYREGLFLGIAPVFITLTASYALISLVKTGEIEKELHRSLELMRKVGLARRSAPDSSQWLSSLLQMSCLTMEATLGWIQVVDSGGEFRMEASWGCSGDAEPRSLDGGLCRTALSAEGFLLSRELHRELSLSAFERAQNADALLCFPLAGSRGAMGVLALGKKKPGVFTANQITQMVIVSAMAGALLDNLRLSRRNSQLFVDAISSLAQAVDARDPYTFGHSSRVSALGKEIATRLGLNAEDIRRVELAGLLHDVGKIGVPEAILRKPGKLTDEEFAIMKRHPETGVKILAPLDEIYSLLPLISAHHEKLSGSGYPLQLKGEEIPLGSRILAVADVYDALTSERPYRNASPPQDAVAIIREQFVGELDSDVVEVLVSLLRARGDIHGA